MSQSYAALTIAIFLSGVGASTDLEESRCGSCEEAESDAVTLMQKMHVVSYVDKRVTAMHSAAERESQLRKAEVTARLLHLDAMSFFQDPRPVDVTHGAAREGIASTSAAASAVASVLGGSAGREDATAEEIGEQFGAAFAEDFAAVVVHDSAPEAAEQPSGESRFVSMRQDCVAKLSRTLLQHVVHARDSAMRISLEVSSISQAVLLLSFGGVLSVLACVAVFISSLGSVGSVNEPKMQQQVENSTVGGVLGMPDIRGPSPPLFSKASTSNLKSGPNILGKVVEPPLFHAVPPRQDSALSIHGAPVFREGAANTLPSREVSAAVSSDVEPWSAQLVASASAGHIQPELCPKLVLPASDSHFAVRFDMLQVSSVPHEFDIVGMSLMPVLHACVKQAGAGRKCLEISMVKHYSWLGGAPHATVLPVPEDDSGKASFEVFGPDRRARFTLQLFGSGDLAQYVLALQGQTVLTIHIGHRGQPIRVLNAKHSPVCSVDCLAERLQFRVPPGVDAVLVLACVLAIFVLAQ